MALNTYPYSPYPASTEQLHKGDNEDLQTQIDAIKDGTTIDSFGDVETALADKTDTAVIAPEFDAEAGTYDVGDMVTYEGKLYEFTSAHSTAGAWDPTEVTEKTVADEIGTVKSGLTDLSEEVNGDATTYPYADVITIEDAVPANLADCSVKIEPVQSGSGDPSPTNIRPITGHTEVSVEVTDGDETTKTYTIALGDTIYGGTVDFDSGVMTVDRECFIGDGSSDEDWNITGTGRLQIRNISNVKQYTDITNEFLICSIAVKSASSSALGTITYSSGYFVLYLNEFKEKTLDEWKAYIASNPIYICYELATPTTIQLTPQQIQLLKGTNTLTASTGQISVTVNGVSGSIGAVQTQANATDAALAELVADIAEQLPTAPTTDGAYVLTVTVADGTPTYSWESAT